MNLKFECRQCMGERKARNINRFVFRHIDSGWRSNKTLLRFYNVSTAKHCCQIVHRIVHRKLTKLYWPTVSQQIISTFQFSKKNAYISENFMKICIYFRLILCSWIYLYFLSKIYKHFEWFRRIVSNKMKG